MIELPLRQFEDLQVNNDGMRETEVGGEIEAQEVEEGTIIPPSNVPVDVKMEVIKERTHHNPTDLPTISKNSSEHNDERSASLPVIDIIEEAQLTADEEEQLQEDPPQKALPLDYEYWTESGLSCFTRDQCKSAEHL